MRPAREGAGRLGAAGAAEEGQRTDILAEHIEVGKQAALTRLGEMLKAAKGNPGGRGCAVPKENRTLPTLADLGIDKKESVSTGLTQSSFGRVTS